MATLVARFLGGSPDAERPQRLLHTPISTEHPVNGPVRREAPVDVHDHLEIRVGRNFLRSAGSGRSPQKTRTWRAGVNVSRHPGIRARAISCRIEDGSACPLGLLSTRVYPVCVGPPCRRRGVNVTCTDSFVCSFLSVRERRPTACALPDTRRTHARRVLRRVVDPNVPSKSNRDEVTDVQDP